METKKENKAVRKFLVKIYGVSGIYEYQIEGFNTDSVVQYVRSSILPRLKSRGLVA